MVGDFNLPDIDWEEGTAKSRADMELLEAAHAANMDQMTSFPTHVRGNRLDLILTNVPEKIRHVEDAGRLGRSDHSIISFEIVTKVTPEPAKTVKNWRRADWASIRDGLRNTVWPTTEDNTSVEEFWQKIRNRISVLTEQHVPVRQVKGNRANWMSNEILQLIRKKKAALEEGQIRPSSPRIRGGRQRGQKQNQAGKEEI
jgi:Endonuclease-reverse transcriptase